MLKKIEEKMYRSKKHFTGITLLHRHISTQICHNPQHKKFTKNPQNSQKCAGAYVYSKNERSRKAREKR